MTSIYANNVSVGDLLLEEYYYTIISNNTSLEEVIKFRFAAVTAVTVSSERGMYMPLVRGGDLIVNGVVVSPHCKWFLDPYRDLLPGEGYLWQVTDFYEAFLYATYVAYRMLGPEAAETFFEWLGLHNTWRVFLKHHSALIVMALNLLMVALVFTLATIIRRQVLKWSKL